MYAAEYVVMVYEWLRLQMRVVTNLLGGGLGEWEGVNKGVFLGVHCTRGVLSERSRGTTFIGMVW